MRKKILWAYWLRYWHCLYYTALKPLSSNHRMETHHISGLVAKIACTCGKTFYERGFLDIYNEVNGTKWRVEKDPEENKPNSAK